MRSNGMTTNPATPAESPAQVPATSATSPVLEARAVAAVNAAAGPASASVHGTPPCIGRISPPTPASTIWIAIRPATSAHPAARARRAANPGRRGPKWPGVRPSASTSARSAMLGTAGPRARRARRRTRRTRRFRCCACRRMPPPRRARSRARSGTLASDRRWRRARPASRRPMPRRAPGRSRTTRSSAARPPVTLAARSLRAPEPRARARAGRAPARSPRRARGLSPVRR